MTRAPGQRVAIEWVCRVREEIAKARDAGYMQHGALDDWFSDLGKCLLALAPPRKKPIRRSKTSLKSRATVKELDRITREIVFERDGGCRFCAMDVPGVSRGAGKQLQWCHIYSRRYRWLRHDLHNSVCLCAGHHMWAHHNPADSTAYFEDCVAGQYGTGAWQRLRLLASKPRKVSPELVRAYLEGERRKMGA